MAVSNPRLLVGHTGITWQDDNAEAGIKCISELGFNSIEVFAWVLKDFYESGKRDICQRYNIPLISSYYSIDILNPVVRDAEMKKLSDWTDIVMGMGGKYATFGGNGIKRSGFDFNEHKKYIVSFVNEAAKIIDGKGMRLNFHPHTGTPIETDTEIVSFFDAVDTKYVGFAPDLGQIQKGGADPMRFVKDYISTIKLVHLKDFSGKVQYDGEGNSIDTTGFVSYTPLGQGVVDLAGILEFLENSSFDGPIMVELDRGNNMPITAEEAVTIDRDFMKALGYRFVKR
ncbi:MAG: sugar phosphate isomerase/epimerase [Treponema sp.]|jgi:inosose dehydratase|nr:sugar phosphate isomerase/epimerase [Treponema sp.]